MISLKFFPFNRKNQYTILSMCVYRGKLIYGLSTFKQTVSFKLHLYFSTTNNKILFTQVI